MWDYMCSVKGQQCQAKRLTARAGRCSVLLWGNGHGHDGWTGMRGAAGRVVVAGALLMAGCQTTPILQNPPLQDPAGTAAPGAPYRYAALAARTDPAVNSEKLLVMLSFSGGGTRAAALAYGVLEKLRGTTIRLQGEKRRRSLLNEVDIISANSGGSFAAAFFGLFRDRMFERDASGMTLFQKRMLYRDIESDLTGKFLSNLFRVNTSAVNRSDLAAELYADTIFDNRTFADLNRRGRPYIIINAHDTTKGARFEFTQDQFDLICSALGPVPVARAVTASSAVHGVFAPIKLRNHDLAHCPPEPSWVRVALNGGNRAITPADNPRDRLLRARLALWYRTKARDGLSPDPKAKYYVHLGDGGVVDNLGLRAPLLALTSRDASWGLREKLASGRVRKVLLIVVNAASTPEPDKDRDLAGPTITQMMMQAAKGAIHTVTEDTLRSAQWIMHDLKARSLARGRRATRYYGPVIVEFEGITNNAERACFRRIKTKLTLPRGKVDSLRRVAWHLLDKSAEYRRFLAESNARETPMPALPGAARVCPAKN